MNRVFETFEELTAYKMGKEIRQEISQLVKIFPKYKDYKLTDQIIRSSRSVTANIAEGHGGHYPKENMKSCIIARGYMNETIDHLSVALDENYIDLVRYQHLRDKILLNIKVLNGYMSYLKKQIPQKNIKPITP